MISILQKRHLTTVQTVIRKSMIQINEGAALGHLLCLFVSDSAQKKLVNLSIQLVKNNL